MQIQNSNKTQTAPALLAKAVFKTIIKAAKTQEQQTSATKALNEVVGELAGVGSKQAMASAITGRAVDANILYENVLNDLIAGRSTPKIVVVRTASAADIRSGKAPANALTVGEKARFLNDKNVIFVAKGLPAEATKQAIRRSLGEAVGYRARQKGIRVPGGNAVGYRFAKTLTKQEIGKGDWDTKTGLYGPMQLKRMKMMRPLIYQS